MFYKISINKYPKYAIFLVLFIYIGLVTFSASDINWHCISFTHDYSLDSPLMEFQYKICGLLLELLSLVPVMKVKAWQINLDGKINKPNNYPLLLQLTVFEIEFAFIFLNWILGKYYKQKYWIE